MAIYYKFDLRYVESIKNFNFKMHIGRESDGGIKLYNIFNKLSSKDKKRLQEYLNKFTLSVNKLNEEDIKELEILINSIDKDISFTFSNNITNTIIGEIVYDQDNNRYIKEIISDLIFPIPSEKNISNLSYEILKSYEVILQINRKFNISSLLKIRIVALNERYATQNEIDEYLNKYNQKSFKGKRQKEVYLKELKNLYNENVYKEGVSFFDRSPLKDRVYQMQNKETIIMENIEFLLQELLIKNKDLYIKYKNEYQEILNSQDKLTLTPLTINNLTILESKIEFLISYDKKDGINIVEYLKKLKGECLINFFNNKQIEVSISYNEIDKITELFLKQKDEYNLVIQREVLKNLAFLYLFKIKEEIQIMDSFKLENSYFQFLFKSVILWIRVLENENIIKDNIIMDLTSNLNSSIVLEIIRKIEFNYIDDKELIKRLNI